MKNNSFSAIYSFLSTLFNYAGFRLFKASGLLLISSFFQGFSLLMLIPLLGLAGINSSNKTSDSINAWLQSFLNSFNISFNLISVLGFFLLLIILEAVLTRYRIIVLNTLNLDFTNHLRNSLYRLIANSNWQFHKRNHSSKYIHLLDNAVNSLGDCTYYTLQLCVYITQVIVFLFVAFTLSIPMTIVMILTGIILFTLIRPINKKVFKHGIQAVSTNQRLYKNMVEFFGGLKLAKSYNRIEQHTKQFNKTGAKLLIDEKAVESASSLAQMWLRILTVSLLCIFVYVAIAILQISIERLLVLIVLVNRLYALFSNSQNYWQSLLHEIPNFVTYKQATSDLHNHQESPQNSSDTILQLESEVKLENISFQYQKDTERQTLTNVSVAFPAYKTTAVIGESGSGKSTLADIVIGLLIPNSGNIYIDKIKLTADLLYNWRETIAYLPQEVYLFDGTIRSNMQWIKDDKISDKKNLVCLR